MFSGFIWEIAGWIALGVKVLALVDVPRRPAEAFPFLNRLTKNAWLAIIIGSVVAPLVFVAWGLTGIIGLIACGIYLADLKPKIDEMQRNSGRY